MSSHDDEKRFESRQRQPATTPEDREQLMISLADELAERQLREGNASSQVITHYLKLGTSRERLEQERIRNENLLLQEKRKAMESQAKSEEMLAEVLDAMRRYAGADDVEY